MRSEPRCASTGRSLRRRTFIGPSNGNHRHLRLPDILMLLRAVLSVLSLLVSVVLLTSGIGMLGTLLALRLELEGYTALRTGLILACYAIGFVLGSQYGVGIIRRVGHIRAFAVFGALASVAILVHPLYVQADLWLGLRLAVGFCVAGLMLIVESWVNAIATTRTRGTLMAIYLALFYLAAAGGQLMIGLGDARQFQLFSVAAILVALSLVPLSLTRSSAPQLPEAKPVGIHQVLQAVPLAGSGALLSGVALSSFTAMGPVYASRIGLSTGKLSLFMGVGILSAMLFQWPVGKLSDSLPRGRVILVLGLLGMIAAACPAIGKPPPLALLMLSVALYVGFASTLYPVSLALALDHMHRDQVVGTNATLLLAFGLGTIVGPLGSAASIWLIGPGGLFLFAAVVMGTLGIAASYSWRSRPQVPVHEQENFVAVGPFSTPALAELDPRDGTYAQREEAAREHQRADARVTESRA